MWSQESLAQYVRAVDAGTSLGALRKSGPEFQLVHEFARAVLVVGLRDLLEPEETGAYFEQWMEITGVSAG